MPELVLKLDLDFKPKDMLALVQDISKRFEFVRWIYPKKINVERVEVYETVKGFHVTIFADSEIEFKDMDKVFFQLLLGSDYKREGFNWVRVTEGNVGEGRWNLLFKDKEQVTSLSYELEALLSVVLMHKV